MLFQIGVPGLRQAALSSIEKLANKGKLPKYKLNLPAGAFVNSTIVDWRKYLATRLDKKLDSIMQQRYLPLLSQEIEKLELLEVRSVSTLLKKYHVGDNEEKAARLLVTFLMDDDVERNKMATITCFNCFLDGHNVSLDLPF